jgi:uncharacterized membrane protein
MRRFVIALAFIFSIGSFVGHVAAKDVEGIYLVSSYPSFTLAGGSGTINLKLYDWGTAPQPMALSVSGLPNGWTAEFQGDGQRVTAAMPVPGGSVDLQLRLTAPQQQAGAKPVDLVVHADGGAIRATLPVHVALGDTLPVSLDVKPDLPSLEGQPAADFSYTLSIRNDSGRDLLVSLGAQTPPNFQATFTKQYGNQQISSLPIKGGTTESTTMKIRPPDNVTAGTYQIVGQFSAAGVTATTPLSMTIDGQSHLSLSTKDERLSGNAEDGKPTVISLVVTNTGTAAAHNVTMSASPPSDWKVDFQPAKIDEIAPNAKINVQATMTPTEKAIAGDYVTTFSASGDGNTGSADYRVTLTTSTLWGVVGLAIIAVALVAVLGVVARFGRR